MNKFSHKQTKKIELFLFALLLLLATSCVIYLGSLKSGMHEDEAYSYYSTAYTYGWNMPNSEWTPLERYFNEFTVSEDATFQYDLVKTVQSWDVHPPMYYWFLHTVESFFPGVFSLWFGLAVNIIAYAVSLIFFYLIVKALTHHIESPHIALAATACYAFSPATLSCAMFIRMYTLLTCFILISFYLHLWAWQEQKLTKPSFLILMAIMVYAGFLTHYYFLIYQFFLTFALCMVMLIKGRKLKYPFIYGLSAVIPLILAYFTYPACLGQMFKGQRGAEATGNFFDLSNTWDRLVSFSKLMNEYLFHGSLPIVISLYIVLIIYLIWKKQNEQILLLGIMLFTAMGYYFAISKTALLLGDSSVRYIYPIFGLILSAIILLLCQVMNTDKFQRYTTPIILVLTFIMLIGNVHRIVTKEILFLYQEDAQKVAYAEEHSSIPVVYIYREGNNWSIWQNTLELLEYPAIYFTSDTTDESIMDDTIQTANELLVYINTLHDSEGQIQRILNSNASLDSYKLIHENSYCSLYYFYDSH